MTRHQPFCNPPVSFIRTSLQGDQNGSPAILVAPVMIAPVYLHLVICLLFGILSGCATRSNVEGYSNLVGQGLLPVSPTNPYVGANLFLAAEAERSGYLLNFLRGRGGPAAIELVNNQFSAPSLLLFYPNDREVFRADLQEQRRGEVVFREWLVRGPYAIERRDYRELAKMDGSLVSEPVFMVRGKETRFGPGSSRNQRIGNQRADDSQIARLPSSSANADPGAAQKQILVPVVPTPKPKTRGITSPSKKADPSPTPVVPLNSDQQALRQAQRQARGLIERLPSGDAAHIVTSEAQTLERLAEWYTGSAANAAKIAAASGLAPGQQPALASRVIIPSDLISKEERLQ